MTDPTQPMSRRRFVGKIITAAQLMMALPFLSRASWASLPTEEKRTTLHYRPLHGDSLRELSRRKAHHGQNVFLNPMGIAREGRLGQVLSWKLFHQNEYREFLDEQPISPVRVDWAPIKSHKGVSVTFVKHATLLIKDLDRYLLVDPVFDEPFWFIKDYAPLAFNLDDMPRADLVLLTHGHYDHLDKPSLSSLQPGTHVISPLGYEAELDSVALRRRTPLDWYETVFDGRREITLLPANHWTMRNPIVGPNRSLWGGYLIKTAGGPVIYVSGDSAYFDGFEQFAEEYAIDLAIFNMGAYEPRWFMAPSHMNPKETVQAFRELRAQKLMITHWGTFQLGDEPVHFPPMDLKNILEEEGLLSRWIDLDHGQTYYF